MLDDLLIESIENIKPDEALKYLNQGADPNSKNILNESALEQALMMCYLLFPDVTAHIDTEQDIQSQALELVNTLIDSGAKTGKKISKRLLESGIPIDEIKSIFKKAKLKLPGGDLLSLFVNHNTLVHDHHYTIELIELIEELGAEFDSEFLGVTLVGCFLDWEGGDYASDDNREKMLKDGIPLIKYLVKRGANINIKSKHGHTVLMRAALNESPEACNYLIQQGADVNAQSEKGFTALMFVSGQVYKLSVWVNGSGQTEVAKILLANGADINLKSNNRRTALSLAKSSKNEAMIELLSKYNSNF